MAWKKKNGLSLCGSQNTRCFCRKKKPDKLVKLEPRSSFLDSKPILELLSEEILCTVGEGEDVTLAELWQTEIGLFNSIRKALRIFAGVLVGRCKLMRLNDFHLSKTFQ